MPLDPDWIEAPVTVVRKEDDVGRIYGWLRGDQRRPPVIHDGDLPYAVPNPRALLSGGAHQGMRAHKAAQPVPCLDPDEPMDALFRKFHASLVPYLPVRGRKGALGVVWARTVLERAFGTPPPDVDAAGACERAPMLRPGDPLDDARQAFLDGHLEDLPVLDGDGRLVGSIERSALVFAQDHQDVGEGRQQWVGERRGIFTDPLGGQMGPPAPDVPAGTSFAKLVELLGEHRTLFVRDAPGGSVGGLNATLLLRAAIEADPRFAPPSGRYPAKPAAVPSQR